MKKILIASVALFSLVGCATESSSSDNNSYSPPRETYAPAPVSPPETSRRSIDDVYLETIYNSYPSVKSFGDYELIELGKNLCNAIDGGLTLAGLATLAIQYDVDPEMLGFITGVAIVAYCPSNEWFIKGY
jgi:hypothetical protein